MLPLLEWRDQIEKLITHAAYSHFLPPHTHIALFVSQEAAVPPLGPLVGMHNMDLPLVNGIDKITYHFIYDILKRSSCLPL